jgi:hypothetical protein
MTTGKKLGLALAAPPLVWIAQASVGWFIAAHACPHAMQPLGFSTARVLNALVGLAAVVVTVAAIVYARRAVALPADAASPPEAPDKHDQRLRYVGVWVLFVGVTLMLALVMNALPSLMLHACGETR